MDGRNELRQAMIPYIEQPSIRLGPFTLYAFGVIVAAAADLGWYELLYLSVVVVPLFLVLDPALRIVKKRSGATSARSPNIVNPAN